MITGLHGMSLWGPVGSNADGASWLWWQALQTVGCHHSGGEPAASPKCGFRGYWQTTQASQSHGHEQHIYVSAFDISRNRTASSLATTAAASSNKELLLLVANYGDKTLFNAVAAVPERSAIKPSNESRWTVRQTWPAGSAVSLGDQPGMLSIAVIRRHQLQFVHLV